VAQGIGPEFKPQYHKKKKKVKKMFPLKYSCLVDKYVSQLPIRFVLAPGFPTALGLVAAHHGVSK
jgi:hypothetical protein